MITRFGAIMLLILLATKPLAAAPMVLAVHPYLPVEELQKTFHAAGRVSGAGNQTKSRGAGRDQL